MSLNAPEARKYSPQVLTAIDLDTVKLKDGEYGTPANMNRSLFASINSDAALEAALTYLGRSSSLFTTDTTKFLSHCEGKGLDVVSAASPTLTTEPEDVFMVDGTFLGAAWAQNSVTNLMKNGAADSSLCTNTGWTVGNPDTVHATMQYDADGLTIDNTTYADVITPGSITLTSPVIALPTDFGSASKYLMAAGYMLTTTYNMVATNVSASLTITYSDADNAILDTKTVRVMKGEYNDWVGIENLSVPKLATKFQVIITIEFGATDSKAKLVLHGVMVCPGPLLLPWTKETRLACTASYDNTVDFANGPITASCWSIFKEYSLLTHLGPIGPLFLVNDTVSIGAVHRVASNTATLDVNGNPTGDTTAVLALALYIKPVSGDPIYGPIVTLPADYIGQYLHSCIRIRNDEENAGKAIVEFAIVAGPQIYSSSLSVDNGYIGKFNMTIGSNLTSTEYFNGPVTEVRYDAEWVNDTELYIISLSKKPFSFKKSNDLGNAESSETIVDVLDSTGVNLITNPTGKLALLGWNNYPATGFSAVHNDVDTGNCFMFVGSTPADNGYAVRSDLITVTPNAVYTLRAMMGVDAATVGTVSLGIEWYNASKDFTGDQVRVNAVADGVTKYYKLATTSPTDSLYARVVMLLSAGTTTTKALWARLKLEKGEATQFSDDSGAGYAVYY